MALPHVVGDHVLAFFLFLILAFAAFSDGSIRQVLKLVLCIVGIVVLRREPNIGLPVQPDGQWLNTRDDHPLSNVEFLPKDHQWLLDVLLADPAVETTHCDSLHHVMDIRVDFDATTSRRSPWFYDPQVASVRQTELLLPDQASQLVQHFRYFSLEIGRFHFSKLPLQWSEPCRSSQVDRGVWLRQVLEKTITDCVKI